jgi:pantoate--beta-alanine ligase
VTAPLVVAATRADLAKARDAMAGRVAVVMTLGALHEGHIRLIQVAHKHADSVLVTIFVNPLQFEAGEDLARYPRDLEADLAICAREGVDVVFAPDVDVIYPHDEPVEKVHAGELGERLEGAIRPTHFDGVLTVVAKLFELTRPDVAVFGEKDAQQLELIRRMVAERAIPVELVEVEIVREPGGLALSSRNRYLSSHGHQTALALSRALRAGADRAGLGAVGAANEVRKVLSAAPDVEVDYVHVVDDDTWLEPDERTTSARILVAARVGSTRLIDNVSISLGSTSDQDHAAARGV